MNLWIFESENEILSFHNEAKNWNIWCSAECLRNLGDRFNEVNVQPEFILTSSFLRRYMTSDRVRQMVGQLDFSAEGFEMSEVYGAWIIESPTGVSYLTPICFFQLFWFEFKATYRCYKITWYPRKLNKTRFRALEIWK